LTVACPVGMLHISVLKGFAHNQVPCSAGSVCGCAAGWGGAACDTPRSCVYGSWDMLSGACVCAPGWCGSACNVAYQPPAGRPGNCVHGALLADGSCACGTGYQGSACDAPSAVPAVSYATCARGAYASSQCTCDIGWSGAHCNVRACVMGLPVAAYGGRPEFTCACLSGWEGQVRERVARGAVQCSAVRSFVPPPSRALIMCHPPFACAQYCDRSCRALCSNHGSSCGTSSATQLTTSTLFAPTCVCDAG
jgi:hypothetical protein